MIKIDDHRRFVWRLDDLLHQTGNEEDFLLVSRSRFEVLQVGLIRKSVLPPRVASDLLEVGRFLSKKETFTCKSDHLVQCSCHLAVAQNECVDATLIQS